MTQARGSSRVFLGHDAELAHWLDVQNKRNTVMTFGGGVNEVQRELIAMAGLKLPRVPR